VRTHPRAATGRIDLRTDFGDINLELLPVAPDAVTAYTDFGDVNLRLPLDWKGRLIGDTDFGSVDVRLEDMTVRLFLQRSRRVEAELGGKAEPKITLTTGFGDVRVRCREAEPFSTEP